MSSSTIGVHNRHITSQRLLHSRSSTSLSDPSLHCCDYTTHYIKDVCAEIIRHKPDVVITEKGLSDLAMHFLTKAGISAIRRLRKTDNNRISRACGATIVHRAEGTNLRSLDTFTPCLFEMLCCLCATPSRQVCSVFLLCLFCCNTVSVHVKR